MQVRVCVMQRQGFFLQSVLSIGTFGLSLDINEIKRNIEFFYDIYFFKRLAVLINKMLFLLI